MAGPNDPGLPKLQLAERLDTAAAEALAAELITLKAGGLVLDASQVDHLGARCLEQLLNAAHFWREAGQNFVIEAPSENFLSALQVFGAELSSLEVRGQA